MTKRTKLTAAQKKMRGTYKATQHKEPTAPVSFGPLHEIPSPPEWLNNEVAKSIFTELVSILFEADILQNSDLHQLANLAREMARYRDACDHLDKEGQVVTLSNGYPKMSQYVRVAEKAFSGASELASKFGLDLQGRMKIPAMLKMPRLEWWHVLHANDGRYFEKHFGHFDNKSLEELIQALDTWAIKRAAKGIDVEYKYR
jgi:P27 family predicted phage terminase small subunit